MPFWDHVKTVKLENNQSRGRTIGRHMGGSARGRTSGRTAKLIRGRWFYDAGACRQGREALLQLRFELQKHLTPFGLRSLRTLAQRLGILVQLQFELEQHLEWLKTAVCGRRKVELWSNGCDSEDAIASVLASQRMR